MTSTLLDLSGKIDPLTISVLNQIQQVTSDERIPFFVVGATARDILLQVAHQIDSGRATADIDIAVFLEDWTRFEGVKQSLIQSKDFEQGREIQRLIYRDQMPVDIVPFGGISEADGRISWPPDGSFKMSVAGFEECYRHSIPVRLAKEPDLLVQVVSLAGLAILKLISWDDNTDRRGRDAPDLFFIIRNYLNAGNLDRLFREGADIIEADSYDYEQGSARFLGRDMSGIASTSTKETLIKILERESLRDQGHRLAMDVLKSDQSASFDYDRTVALFDHLLKGLIEAKG